MNLIDTRGVSRENILPLEQPSVVAPATSCEEILDTSGFVLIDSLYRPVYANPESIVILGYPNAPLNPGVLDGILTQKILSFLPRELIDSGNTCSIQFQSGRRRYHCRAFMLEGHWSGGASEKRIALLLERGMPGPPENIRQKKLPAGMHEDPFSFIPDSKYYYFTRAHHEVLMSLRNMVLGKRGIGVLYAQSGMGKTALINYLIENLRSEAEIALFPGSFESRAELIRSVMAILGINGLSKDVDENLRLFESWLISMRRAGRRAVLICDDAQDLDLETIENLCLLSQFGREPQKLLQVVLAGRQELLVKLSENRLDSVSKGINVSCRLRPLDESEVRSYVLHRLRIAGCSRQLFSPSALSSVALYSRGVPLNINMICRHCLSLAASVGMRIIDERIVADSAYDLVLRTQPASVWDDASGMFISEPKRQTNRLHDRRGLKLVQKP
jgi:general secretion pathway protein A